MTAADPVVATRQRAGVRGEWLIARAGEVAARIGDGGGNDVAVHRATADKLSEALAVEHVDYLADVAVQFDLDEVETLIFECLAATELPGGALAAMLELSGALNGGGSLVVDALLAAIAGGDTDVAAAFLARLSPEGQLRKFGLIEVDDARVPRKLAPIRLGAGMLEHLSGQRPAPEGATWLRGAPIDGELYPELVGLAEAALADPDLPLVIVIGMRGAGRSAVVRAASARLSMPVLSVEAEWVAAHATPADIARLGRDVLLARGVLLCENLSAGEAQAAPQQAMRRGSALRALTLLPVPLAFTADADDAALTAGERPLFRIPIGLPDEAQRASLWSRVLPPDQVAPVARTFALTPRAIRHAAATASVLASARGSQDARPTAADARQAIRQVVASSGNVQQLGAESYWRPVLDDLVLSAENRELLEELVTRVRHRKQVLDEWGFRSVVGPSTGIAALLHGPLGTGKSMAAHAIATHLGIECFRIDLSQIVSKWVGETEKQLGRVFDAAERSDALLLFDEADALFTKRTDVKSSNDRYANLEVNYLLQRIESFPGLAVLTTNHAANIDSAFMRRLQVQIRFDFPDSREREKLWRMKLPPGAPLDADVALDRLADQYPMTGARIRNAALRAAFYAADAKSPITMALLKKAVTAEYQGAGLTPGATRPLE